MSLKIAFDWHLRYSASAVHHKRPFFVNPLDFPFVLLNARHSSLSKSFVKLWLLIDMRKFTLLFFCEFSFSCINEGGFTKKGHLFAPVEQ